MEQVTAMEWIAGAIFVGVNAYRRYNTPKTNRASTTFRNFITYFCFYLMTVLTLYLFCAALFDSSPQTIGALYGVMLGQPVTTLPDQVSSLSAPMVAALFLTTLLPSLPWLSRYDEALLNIFWDRGHIPTHVHKMTASMRRAPFTFSPLQIKKLRQRAVELGFDYDQISFDEGTNLNFRWARINAVLDGMGEWHQDDVGRLRRFMQENKLKVEELLQRRSELNKEFADLQSGQLEHHVLQKIERFLDRAINDLFRDTSLLIARATCIAELSESGRESRVAQLGFDGSAQGVDSLSPNQLAGVALAIFVTFFAVSLSEELVKPAEYRKFGNIIFMTLLMMLTYGTALLIALDLKRRVSIGYNELTKCRPWLGYFTVGAITLVGWLVVTFSYRYMYNMLVGMDSDTNVDNVLENIGWSFPYALQSLALALAISGILDFHQSRGLFERPAFNLKLPKIAAIKLRLRLFDVAVAVVAMSVASVVAFCWMEGLAIFEGVATRDEQYIGKTSLLWFMAKAISVGAVLGWLVPEWFYVNRSKSPDQIAGRLIAMNRKPLSKEIRQLFPNELGNVVAVVAASVAVVDQQVSRTELDVYQIICSHLAGLPHSDLDMDLVEKEFRRCVALSEDDPSQLETLLQTSLEKVNGLPFLSSLMPFIASSIAFADGVYLDKEQQVVEQIQGYIKAH